jgi:hypothetical protein
VLDFIDDAMIAASQKVPIKLDANILEVDDLDQVMERLLQGHFIIYVGIGETGVYDKGNIQKYRQTLDRLKSYVH